MIEMFSKKKIVIGKLNDYKNQLEELKSLDYNAGGQKYDAIFNRIKRIIENLHDDADNVINSHFSAMPVVGVPTEQEMQEAYIETINSCISLVETILEDAELFGFKEKKERMKKTETEIKAGFKRLGFRRKTSK